ncbi:hypothetical protein EUTSA_v10000668mg [Eutrema salsugineum]|uniref:Zinc finger PHD-type domain-containing protein n=1 Tax=Eutrema salsugineum TaxID=72664 RepID=V4NIU6_EUTSA|nr:hypothetical protein EUTSA_v10000668mg [Eutrema salsugineum]
MSSVGVFREEEIDGKTFYIYSGESSINSGDLDLPPLQPLFLCPFLRYKAHNEKNPHDEFLLYKISPHFHNTDEQVQQHLPDSDCNDSNCDDDICKLPVVPIFWCNDKQPDYDQFRCSACLDSKLGTDYYICLTCDDMFHKECVESPLEIKHPSYPFLSLQLYIYSRASSSQLFCLCCKENLFGILYHCPTYKLSMHPVCAMKPIPIFIDHPKSHPHQLTLFAKQDSLLCNVCGLIEKSVPTYVCNRCVFVVHQYCIYIPYVIKLWFRHHHRISFSPSRPSGKWSCRVCYEKVDNSCGGYCCDKCSDYFVHTKCALRSDVWDGVDLEGVPEEPEIIVEPYETIADGIILHFSHGHHLKLEISIVYDEDRFCQACILPIYEGNYYSCMDGCNFVLHEACVNAPCKIHHALHPRPLTLKVSSDEQEFSKGFFKCDACYRESCGFVYEVGGCSLDMRCALVSEPFDYEGHEHPLFLTLDREEEERKATCQICQEQHSSLRKLNCIECDYVICFRCVTLPYRAKYEYDKHFLTFQNGKDGRDQLDWCDVCERKISSKDGFYECHDCCITLHVHCLLGREPYMQKPGQTIMFENKEFHILPNNIESQPFCYNHDQLDHDEDRFPHKVVFEWEDKTYCSFLCMIGSLQWS